MSECEKCGRDDGHYIGCTAALRAHARNLVGPDFMEALCAFDGCNNPRRPKGKGPAPKFCTEHSDPKNRK